VVGATSSEGSVVEPQNIITNVELDVEF